MKTKILALLLLLTSCAHAEPRPDKLAQCIEDQIEAYGDLCAESASGYEEMSGSEAHYEGVKCAVEGIKICLGVEK